MMNSKIQKAEDGKNAGSAKKCVQTGKKVADKKDANKKQAAQVAVFENPEFGMVRTTIDEKGDPWFCAKDLCDVLGYRRAYDTVKQRVSSSDTIKYSVTRTVKNRYGECSGRGLVVQMIFVNESGFYALVLGSKLATAVKFKDWVTSVVLPQIRKTGGYIPVHEGESEEETIRYAEKILRATLKKKEELLEQQKKLIEEQKARLDGQKAWIADQDARLIQQKALLHQKEVQMGLDKKLIGEQDVEIRRLNGVVDEQVVNIARKGENIIHLEHQVDGLMPKAIYSDNVLDSVSCFTTTQVAKELGITAQELNRSLCALHIQYYQSGQYMLYAEYAHMGLAKSRTRYNAFLDPKCDGRKEKMGKAVTHTYLVWTEKGRKFIHDLAHRFWELAELYEVKNLG
ncbi:phage antirepressor KilAC domain-containing protein [Prevotella copri]|uniref:Phage antirepressor KilAC domain-containing protein n=6 Tax=Segatella copri TaxID=165179 RepID=A0AAW5IJB7_9BACT|nr:BRO family protein [Segatella copri]MCP9535141.1 phage antirepressor KilAC domain-containing protein [Segatella copri]MCP9538148.1 phage antirepressor KilAC domain-containing protein [Segatella copri]MCP9540997.1 phage antirepressor KilAC domain-containing protein [Segatella copri]MCP9559308.1 phage antirepressor KilAC domain-containing protein [Segatella copri]MCP9562098.1 phage antirepressor KilAC domain-containing protein [Segatella copri]